MTCTTAQVDAPAPAPALRIRGNATPEEIAALLVAFGALRVSGPPPEAPHARWRQRRRAALGLAYAGGHLTRSHPNR